MQGLHLTGDLFDCACSSALLTDVPALSALCRRHAGEAGLTVVGDCFHGFAESGTGPGGVTGTLLLAESHLAVHTWPERRVVALDVYVCNFSGDNHAKAEHLFEALALALRPGERIVNRLLRGDVARVREPVRR